MLVWVLALSMQATDSVYATPALRAMVERASIANRLVPAELRSYRVRVESELAILARRREEGEAAVQVEQVASDATWARSGAYEQRVIGYRAQFLGFGFSALTYFRRAWTVPVLYGNRLGLFFGSDSADARRRRRRADLAMHPLAVDRDSVYRFTGGDTVGTLHVMGRRITIARIHVEPRRAPGMRIVLFSGDLDVDAERYQIVRMRGRFVTLSPRAGGRGAWLRRAATFGITALAYVELENGEVEGRYWLPAYQRVELQGVTAAGIASVFRIVSRFADFRLNEASSTASAANGPPEIDTLTVRPHRLTFAPHDSVERYRRWGREPGSEVAATSATDFDDVAPAPLRPSGPPTAALESRRLAELVRYNRVEGWYTGAAGVLRFRDAAPGLALRARSGWAWTQRSLRGGADVALVRGQWLFTAGAERALAHTNDFVPYFEPDATFSALFGIDYLDYVDRRSATLGVTRALGAGRSVIVRLDGGWASDRPEVRRVYEGPIGRDTFRINRPAARGEYARAAVSLQYEPAVSGDFLQSGVGGSLRYERGSGGLDWQRVEGRVTARRTLGAVTAVTRLDAGAVLASAPPPQQLFELGGAEGLPGYRTKAFAGDRAVLGRAMVMYSLPLLRAPFSIGRLLLPGISPAPSVGLQAGWTGATAAAGPAVDLLGSRTTGRVRASVDLRLRFFGGAASIGLARAVDQPARWRVVAALGGQL